ncbi:SDR family NAD(P)-dependent oxidoreductase [Haladaptatus sp. F3-133]|uniref:SDR family NAD(P)-dependent oxidoreductase n=1 Tax=Halorutilus salinus TaxID=2487751 RepID=A0A9Q4GIA3_9EURY|nr:SDR family oxidoreductase [Halorutilus salinus]MCX2818618.1 SDR family NAD(P)-dependent oxidoreductase [Halorutilus salinus]
MVPFSVNNRTAIITGSTRGIGEATARRLAEANASVVVSGRAAEDGKRVADSIRADGGEAVFVRADMREPDDIESLVKAAVDEFGGLDILVNNAGYETETSPEEVDIETWNGIVETDFRAYWLTAKHAYPYLVESDFAAVVNMSSNHSFATQPKKFPYNAVKAGIDGMTRSMAVAWGVDGIRVNSVNPGWTMVGRIEESLTDEELSELERIHPLGRIGTPKDVADAVLYLASDMASFVTGECHVVDGGRTAVLQDDLYLDDHGLE